MPRSPRASGACVSCGRVMMTAWYQNAWGERWCKEHGKLVSCAWCQRVDQVALDAGRPRCHHCRATGVADADQVAALQAAVLDVVTAWIGPHDLRRVPVAAVGGSLVVGGSRRVGRTHSWTSGDIGSAQISFTPGMPRVLAGAVLAHEYGHVLLTYDPVSMQRRPRIPTDPKQVEGFCEVLAAEWLSLAPSPESAHHRMAMDTSPDPTYGEGFRQMWQRREALGSVRALLDELAPPAPSTRPAATIPPARSRVRRSTSTPPTRVDPPSPDRTGSSRVRRSRPEERP